VMRTAIFGGKKGKFRLVREEGERENNGKRRNHRLKKRKRKKRGKKKGKNGRAWGSGKLGKKEKRRFHQEPMSYGPGR